MDVVWVIPVSGPRRVIPWTVIPATSVDHVDGGGLFVDSMAWLAVSETSRGCL